MTDHVATASTEIDAPPGNVWAALTEPRLIAAYMFGAQVDTDWQEGNPITWEGEYEGRAYRDRGVIVVVEPGRRLELTHYSPLSGKPDVPENYHALSYELTDLHGRTLVRLSQDNNASPAEAEHSRSNWEQVLSGLKRVVEGG